MFFSCFRAKTLFLCLNEFIFNVLHIAQKMYKNVRIAQTCTKTAFVRTTIFCTKVVLILCKLERLVYQSDARGTGGTRVHLHKNLPIV